MTLAPRTPLWKSIAAVLRSDLDTGHYRAGDKLPTETELSDRFGVNRHTVRRALADLIDQNLLYSRRGSGVFVVTEPTAYPIGKRVRFHQNLAAAGRTGDRRILHLETRAADDREASALHLPRGAPVHVCEILSSADGVPMALAQSVFPANRLPDLMTKLAEQSSITAALRHCGVADYTRIHTLIDAKLATAAQAHHLNLREGDPILRTTSINADLGGRPVEYGRTWFAASRVTLTVQQD